MSNRNTRRHERKARHFRKTRQDVVTHVIAILDRNAQGKPEERDDLIDRAYEIAENGGDDAPSLALLCIVGDVLRGG